MSCPQTSWLTGDTCHLSCSLTWSSLLLHLHRNIEVIQPVHSEGDQPWDFFGRNDAKDETPVLCPPHAKSWLIGKDSDAGRDWGAGGEGDDRGWDGWMASLTRWTWVSVNSRIGDGQGGLVCCDSWGCKESDTTERLIWSMVRTNRLGKILHWHIYTTKCKMLIDS